MAANLLQDAIKRVREGQGAEVDGGFSFRSKIDQWSTQRNRDVRPGQTLDQIRPTTAVLFLPAEKDELTQGPGWRDRSGEVPRRPRRAVSSDRAAGADALPGVFERRALKSDRISRRTGS